METLTKITLSRRICDEMSQGCVSHSRDLLYGIREGMKVLVQSHSYVTFAGLLTHEKLIYDNMKRKHTLSNPSQSTVNVMSVVTPLRVRKGYMSTLKASMPQNMFAMFVANLSLCPTA
eukprot:m.143600 g.143600  ORF g.143600 m.143600 type:complete len:118 (-) comp14902_c0_seq1:396-749(-)